MGTPPQSTTLLPDYAFDGVCVCLLLHEHQHEHATLPAAGASGMCSCVDTPDLKLNNDSRISPFALSTLLLSRAAFSGTGTQQTISCMHACMLRCHAEVFGREHPGMHACGV
jgi:hypothetical protein